MGNTIQTEVKLLSRVMDYLREHPHWHTSEHVSNGLGAKGDERAAVSNKMRAMWKSGKLERRRCSAADSPAQYEYNYKRDLLKTIRPAMTAEQVRKSAARALVTRSYLNDVVVDAWMKANTNAERPVTVEQLLNAVGPLANATKPRLYDYVRSRVKAGKMKRVKSAAYKTQYAYFWKRGAAAHKPSSPTMMALPTGITAPLRVIGAAKQHKCDALELEIKGDALMVKFGDLEVLIRRG